MTPNPTNPQGELWSGLTLAEMAALAVLGPLTTGANWVPE
jgi:hypothetical protein